MESRRLLAARQVRADVADVLTAVAILSTAFITVAARRSRILTQAETFAAAGLTHAVDAQFASSAGRDTRSGGGAFQRDGAGRISGTIGSTVVDAFPAPTTERLPCGTVDAVGVAVIAVENTAELVAATCKALHQVAAFCAGLIGSQALFKDGAYVVDASKAGVALTTRAATAIITTGLAFAVGGTASFQGRADVADVLTAVAMLSTAFITIAARRSRILTQAETFAAAGFAHALNARFKLATVAAAASTAIVAALLVLAVWIALPTCTAGQAFQVSRANSATPATAIIATF